MVIDSDIDISDFSNLVEKYVSSDRKRAIIEIDRLKRGFGTTIGNSLRRVMLSSLSGAAVTSVKIEKVVHEFSSIPGVSEDVPEIIQNIRKIPIKKFSNDKKRIYLDVEGPMVVKSGNIETGADVNVIDTDIIICHVDKGYRLQVEMAVESGEGYCSYSDGQYEYRQDLGMIAVNALFSPVVLVSFTVEESRVGQFIGFDKLIMDITTNGVVSPKMAVAMAAKILQEQLNSFVDCNVVVAAKQVEEKEELPFNKLFLKKIENLELSVRAHNCLKNEGIVYVGDLVRKTEPQMMKAPNFGRKTLNEIKLVLISMGLRFGMEIDDWPPQNIEELVKKYDDTNNVL